MNQSRSCHEVDAEVPLPNNSPESYGAALQLAAAFKLNSGEAQILICNIVGCNRATLLAFPERPIDPATAHAIRMALERRRDGVPVAYLTGKQEFYGLSLSVSPVCLIPRADTETLVDQALELFADRSDFRALDLGTGSGAIALALKANRPAWCMHAIDRSGPALALAKRNAQSLGLDVQFHEGDWFSPLATDMSFNLIVSNPPYIAQNDPHLGTGDLRFEPPQALSSGIDGLDDLRKLIQAAPGYLTRDGCLMLEHGYQQADAVQLLLRDAGFDQINSIKDLGGNWRITLGFQSAGLEAKRGQR